MGTPVAAVSNRAHTLIVATSLRRSLQSFKKMRQGLVLLICLAAVTGKEDWTGRQKDVRDYSDADMHKLLEEGDKDEVGELTSLWQTGLMNNHVTSERFQIEDDR